MNGYIAFPHLHIELEHVGRSVTLFGVEIAYYGILIALAMAAGLWLVCRLAVRSGQKAETYMDFAAPGLVLAILGARLYYVAFSWSYYREHPAQILNLRGGGLAIYGGILAGSVCAWIWCRMKKTDLRTFLDTAMPGVALGQAIGRWGNFFNREAFGRYTDGLTAMRLPLTDVSSSDVTQEMLSHLVTDRGAECVQVHPTFLYESVWDLLVLGMLLIVWRRPGRPKGAILALYLLGYGLGRLWIEGLRTDQLLWPGTGVAVSQVLSGLLAAAALVSLIVMRRQSRQSSSAGTIGFRN